MLNKIDANPGYSPEYKARLKETYTRFHEQGYEFTEHALGRMIGQKHGKGKKEFTADDILRILGKPVNYTEGGEKSVKYHEDIAAIIVNDTGEIVSVFSFVDHIGSQSGCK